MRIVLLAGASSIHTLRWANGLNAAGVEVHVISQHDPLEDMDAGVQLHLLPFRGIIGYFTMVPAVKKLLNSIQPDLVNAHFASGYATTAKLAGHHPWLLSVWGTDVYDFPYVSSIHRKWVRSNLLAADAVASTSHCMAEQTWRLAPEIQEIAITPFGVDTARYQHQYEPLQAKDPEAPIVLGTVKVLAPKYGVDTFIEAFALLRQKLQTARPQLAKRLQLRIVGDGPQKTELEHLAANLGLADCTTFPGRVLHSKVPEELAKLDVYVALSRLDSESFGVAIIEASAAGRPVVVSDAGGLPEVVMNNETGLIVPRENPQAAAEALCQLVLDPELRMQMGEAGKKHVFQKYDWSACVQQMISVYRDTITTFTSANG